MKQRTSFLIAFLIAAVASFLLGKIPVSSRANAESPQPIEAPVFTPAPASAPEPTPEPAPAPKKKTRTTDEPTRQVRRIGDFIAQQKDSPQETLLAALAPDDEMRLELIREWSRTEPARAASWASALPPGGAREAALDQVALGWLEKDAPAAVAWASGVSDDTTRERLLHLLATQRA